jgi:N utilization substance protein A
MDLKNFASAVAQIGEEKGLSKEKITEIIEQALAAAYKKDYGKKGQIIKAELNLVSGEAKFWQIKTTVEEEMIYSEEELLELKEMKEEGRELPEEEKEKIRFNPEKHIMIEEAKKNKPEIEVGEELIISLEVKSDYGRIAAQTAKQVIIQGIREAEKKSIFEEYKNKEDDIVSGIIQRIEGKNILFDLGKTLGVLTREEQVPGEFYRAGQRLRVYILKVEETPRGPKIFLSRSYPKLVSKLFELEVPEISSGAVAIKSIAREAGSRTKIAVFSNEENIDPIGASVGQRGTRVQIIINELGGEKIDIVEYSEDPKEYISNALSPAKVLEIKILPKNKALAVVPEDQLSLAIGKNGQNVRLAAKLTGWKIDVRGPSEETTKEEVGSGEESLDVETPTDSGKKSTKEVSEEKTAEKEKPKKEKKKKTKKVKEKKEKKETKEKKVKKKETKKKK